MEKYAAIILGAGKGTRMNEGKESPVPKVMSEILGEPVIKYSVQSIKNAGINHVVVVVGYKQEIVRDYLGDSVEYAVQDEQLGTGHAAKQAESVLIGKAENLIVFYGDNPLFRTESIKKLIAKYEEEKKNDPNVVVGMLTVSFSDPMFWGFGRIIRNQGGDIVSIIEQKDCNEEQKRIKECNPGFYIFDADWFWANAGSIRAENSQKEYYLTDMIGIANKQSKRIIGSSVIEEGEVHGINTPEQLEKAEEIIKKEHHSTNKKYKLILIICDNLCDNIRGVKYIMIYKTRGIILKRINYSEADRIITILSEKNGKIRVIAKGVRKIKSKLSGNLELFCNSALNIAEGKNLDIVTAAQIQKCYPSLRKTLNLTRIAQYFAEIVDVLTIEGDPHPEIYILLDECLQNLDQKNNKYIIPYFELNILNYLGYLPELHKCSHCRKKINENEKIFFGFSSGGLVCDSCRKGDQQISVDTIKILRLMLKYELKDIVKINTNQKYITELEQITNRFLVFHAQKEIKSRKFLF